MTKLSPAPAPAAPREAATDQTAAWLEELSAALRAETSLAACYGRWSAALVDRLAALGAVLHVKDAAGRWSQLAVPPAQAVALGSEERPSRLGALVFETFASGGPKFVPGVATVRSVRPGGGGEAAQHLTALVPLAWGERPRGVLEIHLPAEAPPERQAETLRIVRQSGVLLLACEQREWQRLQAKLACVDELDRFAQVVHAQLAVRATAYVIANDGKRLVGCDRVSVLVRRGRRYELTAVSGLEIVETRAASAKLLRELVTTVGEVGVTLRHPGDELEQLTPPVRAALESYLDETHVRSLVIVPLRAKNPTTPEADAARPLGAVVLEHFASADQTALYAERGSFLAEHAGAALRNAAEFERIPLQPLWRAWRRGADCFAQGTRRRTLAIIGGIAACAAALCLIPADFEIHAEAVLRPAHQRSAFAPSDGIVKQLFVRHGDPVGVGQPVAQLENTDLEVDFADVAGQRSAAQEQLSAIERSLYEDSTRLAVQDRHRLSGQRSELKQKLAALDAQLDVLKRKRAALLVTSPIAGEVLTWNVEQLLANRPVRTGQVLLEIGETGAEWELEIQVPEDDVGHVVRAQRLQDEALAIRYRLASAPAADYRAAVREIQRSAEVRGEDGNTVLVRAALAPGDAPPQRAGAAASAKIACGRRALGYVWLHNAIDFARTKILFRWF